MTREQFLRGYLLLTTQPWGKAYRTTFQLSTGEPSPAEIQIEFYYKALMGSPAEAWCSACEVAATGEQWPSVDTLKVSMKHFITAIRTLPPPKVEYISMREALAERPEQLAILERLLS